MFLIGTRPNIPFWPLQAFLFALDKLAAASLSPNACRRPRRSWIAHKAPAAPCRVTHLTGCRPMRQPRRDVSLAPEGWGRRTRGRGLG
jgi:hypothetical protein